MTRKQKYILLTIVTGICGTIVFLQYQTDKNKHERLLLFGEKTIIIAKPYTSWGINYVNYYFITEEGLRIDNNEKCGSRCNQYFTATAIYNPTNPSEYELSFDFKDYNPTWRIVFFFLMYLPVMTYVAYGFINYGATIYLKLKGRNN